MSLPTYDGPTLTLVVNPTAGRGRARRMLPKVATELLTGMPGANLRVYQTSSFADARLRCIAAVEHARPPVAGHRPDSLLVMGGDGMMHLGLNAAAGTHVPLGLIPAGTGNDFCRGTGVPNDTMAATRTVVAGHTRRIDLMEAEGRLVDGAERRWVGSIVSTGYDGRVNQRTNQFSWTLGGLSYAWAALAELAVFEPLPYRLLVDGTPLEQTAMFISVGNAGYFGGGMMGCPRADVTDGELDLTIINPVSRMTLLRLLPRMYDGGFVHDPAVEQLRAREVVVDGDGLYAMADGEELGPVPLRLRAVPHHLTIYTAPKASPAEGRPLTQ
ncbi:MAG: diacylglycerol kinase family protein [Propionicimonas sp.]|uniref:diacylglycerol/lipid kinase family protein n=1 Tax=Propionicimonas sp. TaxID=1955623 RepID=UPI002B2155C2|nr:diacylglycerol kinase family protein [Propionicimonas sp.]MEA4944051.1 diacylglycerol kinase family protein [Propionicimonas sp.]MEA5052872.1 diacylglycerol kinase family protein [Propionicimonas sp.]